MSESLSEQRKLDIPFFLHHYFFQIFVSLLDAYKTVYIPIVLSPTCQATRQDLPKNERQLLRSQHQVILFIYIIPEKDRLGAFPKSILSAFPGCVLSSATGGNETSEGYSNKWAKLFTKNTLELATTNALDW